MQKLLIDLLNIYGISGNETAVRNYLKPILHDLMTEVFVDPYGNLLASKTYGTGEGANVMLSAHMDTVHNTKKNKKIVNKSGIITAELPNGSRTVLGADDRAGIAIILTVLKRIPESFNGIIKVAFTREEEVGSVGAERLSKLFCKNVNLAIVVDRKGNRDIVVGSDRPYCSDAVGDFMEYVSETIGFDYKCVKGGSSDASIFSRNKINSVNLSSGYQNEHTENEFLSINDMKDTIKLIIETISSINDFYKDFGKVPRNNKWVDRCEFDEDIMWEEQNDPNGLVYAYTENEYIVMKQGEDEVSMLQDNFISLSQKIIKYIGKT